MRRDQDADEKPSLRSIVDQLTAAVADTEAGAQHARAEANAEITQLRRSINELEAAVAVERESSASLRQQLAEAERLRLATEAARDEAVQKRRSLTDDYESRLRRTYEERDTARAEVGGRDEIIGQLKAQSVSDRERHDAAIAQLEQQLEHATSEASRWSSIVHAVERALDLRNGHTAEGSALADAISRRIQSTPPLDQRDSPEQPNDRERAASPPPPMDADTAPAVPAAIDAYARQLLGTAEQMCELDRRAGRPAAEILDRLVEHLRYGRDVVVRRAAGTADGEAVFRRALSTLLNERWEHEFGRTLGFAMYELYGNEAEQLTKS